MTEASQSKGGPQGTVEALCQAVYPSMAMLAGAQLDLFTRLEAGGRMGLEQLALALDVDDRRLRPLLFALVNAGLLQVAADESFSNSPDADRLLVRGRDGFMGDNHELWADLWKASLQTAASIRSGSPQARHEFTSMPEAELEAFLRGLHSGALRDGRSFARRFDLSSCVDLLDLAGGSGGFAIGLAQAVAGVQVTVAELPRVTAITRRCVDEVGLADRIRVIAADLTREPLQGAFDVAMVRNFIQVLSEAEAVAVLRHLFPALRPGGDIYISGDIIDNDRTTPAETVAFSLVFINLYESGQAYTESEYAGWLAAAGFVNVERLDDDTMRGRVAE